ncbi:MAG: hypothetical protein FJ297_01500 [Planctomycetes bacterium]|nr:hypothetical protein [Planctomycetota bacterium]
MRDALILCEPASEWVSSLRAHLDAAGIRVIETRSPRDAWGELRARPTSIVCWSLAFTSPERVAERIFAQRIEYPRSRPVALARRGMWRGWIEWAREAGAVDVLGSTRDLRRAAAWFVDHVARSAPKVDPRPSHVLIDPSWRLPWDVPAT